MLDLLKLVLDRDLQLENLVGVVLVFDRLGDLQGFLVHGGLEQALSVVHFVLVDVWEEFGELVVHVCSISVILNLEVAVSEE
jgi:hypothetical protein